MKNSKFLILTLMLFLIASFSHAQETKYYVSFHGVQPADTLNWGNSYTDRYVFNPIIYYCPGADSITAEFSDSCVLIINRYDTIRNSPCKLGIPNLNGSEIQLLDTFDNNPGWVIWFPYVAAMSPSIQRIYGTAFNYQYNWYSVYCGRNAYVEISSDTIINDDTVFQYYSIQNVVWNYGLGSGPNNIIDDTAFSGANQLFVAHVSIEGCVFIDSLTMHRESPLANLLCFATVDTISMHNIIAFDTDGSSNEGIDSVFLYYYNNSTWIKIGAKPYIAPGWNLLDSTQYFIDTTPNNNPNGGAVQYCVRTLDSCGDTSSYSNFQTTMFITQTPNTSTFVWGSGYIIENINPSVNEYYLYRNDTMILSKPGNISSMSDPQGYFPNAVYYIAAQLNESTCNLTPIAMGHRAFGNVPNSSRTNRLRNGNPVSGIGKVNNIASFKVYPNPSNGSFSLDIQQESDVRIYDIMGQTVYQSRLPQGHNQIDIKGADGIYLISVNGVFNKIIKE